MTTGWARTVLDCDDPRTLAEFYRRLLGLTYAPGHEDTDPDGDDWLVLQHPSGLELALARVPGHRGPAWPDEPAGAHLDVVADDVGLAVARAVPLGAVPLHNPRSTEPATDLQVLADPAGHPFCVVRGR